MKTIGIYLLLRQLNIQKVCHSGENRNPAGIWMPDQVRHDGWWIRSIAGFIIFCILCLTSCRSQIRNIHRFDVQHEKCKAFVVIKQDWHYPFGFVDKENNLRLIQADLDTLGQIETLWFSPTGQKVMIESYGEGHQYISIYSVSALVDHYDQSGMIPPVNTLDPYPYALWNISWIDDRRIQFASHSDFSEFDKKLRRGKYSSDEDDEIERTWLWNVDTDTFKELGSSQKALERSR